MRGFKHHGRCWHINKIPSEVLSTIGYGGLEEMTDDDYEPPERELPSGTMTFEEAVEVAIRTSIHNRNWYADAMTVGSYVQIILEDLLENDPDDYEHSDCYTLKLPKEYVEQERRRQQAEAERLQKERRVGAYRQAVKLVGEENTWKLP